MQIWITFKDTSEMEDLMLGDVINILKDRQYLHITYISMCRFKNARFKLKDIESFEVDSEGSWV